MKLEKPKVARVVLVARDLDRGMKSKCLTLYDATPEQVIALVKEAAAKRKCVRGESSRAA